jgi:hypothetical protein
LSLPPPRYILKDGVRYVGAVNSLGAITATSLTVSGGVDAATYIGDTITLDSNASIVATVDLVTLGAYDQAVGSRTLAIGTEIAVAADVARASTHSIKFRINGADYRVLLSNVA